MTQELKRCPFCGGQAMERTGLYKGDFSYVYCPTCGVRTLQYSDIKDAIKDWNTRVGDDNERISCK